jgi:hypothetical protein
VEPDLSLYVPGMQFVHDVLPSVLVNVPGSHVLQTPLFIYIPAEQDVHELDDPPEL